MNITKIKEYGHAIWNYIVRNNIHWFILITLILAFMLAEYEDVFVLWYDKAVMPIVSQFHSDIFIWLAALISNIMVGVLLYRRYRNEYVYDSRIVYGVSVLTLLILKYRLSGIYDYVSWLGWVSYVDLFLIMGLTYFIMAFIDFIRHENRISQNTKDNTANISQGVLLKDWPIESVAEDVFDLKEEAEKIAANIRNVDRNKTWSFAITAPWGTGKTSFMNMIIEQVKTAHSDDFEFVQFNPRDCKSYLSIQEEFFAQLSCVLSKYNSRCNSTIKDYMASLQLIDNRGIIEKMSNFYRIWDKAELKENIGKSFESLVKRVLVVIDDFDRLSKEEILEVLKLIDSNAAFKNLIFLTAYDKKQVNKALGDAYKTEDACFVDKFFSLEFQIPSRPYTYISQFVIDNMCAMINADSSEKNLIATVVNNNKKMLQDYIPTLRDAKRFVNQVVMDYKQVRGDVLVSEYILVELLKYRYPESLKKLYKKEYIERGGFFSNNGIYYQKDLDGNPVEGIDVIKSLFPRKDSQIGHSYHHVYEVQSFDNYFVNQIYASLRTRDMLKIFHHPITDVYTQLDQWLANEEEAADVVAYLNSFDIDNFLNGDFYRRYVNLVTYVAIKRPQSRAYWLFLRVIYKENLEGYDKKYGLDFDEYKRFVLEILLDKTIDPLYTMLRAMHMNYITGELHDDEELIQDDDIKTDLFQAFIETTEREIEEEALKSWLHNCANIMESGTRKIILDAECAKKYRAHIEQKPDWYIKNFVHLGGVSSNPDWNSIACDGFWKQIFESEDDIIGFIKRCKESGLEGAIVANNFWPIYKANDYKPIEFDNQGNVQDKIDNNLEKEVHKLGQLKAIETEISGIPESKDGMEKTEIDNYMEILNNCQKSLEDIDLFIKLNGNIRKEIEHKYEILK